MKFIIAFLSIVPLCITQLYSQKDKIKYLDFNDQDQVVAVFKSGTVALFSKEDLSLIAEKSPGDKKNNVQLACLSPSRKYVVVADGKVNAWIVYSSSTLEEIKRIPKKGYVLPQFNGRDEFLKDKKILNFPDETVVTDLSGHSSKHEGFIFSPELKTYFNYKTESDIGERSFEIFDYTSGKSLGSSSVGKAMELEILSSTRFIGEDSIQIVFQPRVNVTSEVYQAVIPVMLGDELESVSSIREDYEENFSGIQIGDYPSYSITSGDYIVDIDGDYSLVGAGAIQKANDDNTFVVIGTSKNKINLYSNDPGETQMMKDRGISRLVKSITVSE